MRKLIPLLFALCFVQVFGQTLGFHRTNQVISRANSGVTANVVPYATVFVTYSATGATAAIYQDPGLSVPIPTGVVTADLNGNYGYYISTNYCVNESISAPGQGNLTVQNICQNGTGGSTLAISTNDVNNSSQTALNFLTSTTNTDGLTITPYNTGGGIEQFEITGAYNGNVPTATKLFSTGSNGTYWGVSGGIQQWIAPPGGGTVTSVGLTVPSWLTVSGSPITGSGTFGVTGTSEAQNLFLASPNGSSGALTPRAIVVADLPAAVVTSYPGAGIANSTGSGWGASYTSSNLIPANFISTLNQNTSGYAAGLAGGLLGSAPYQNAINTTLFIASPTTSGHTFFYGWQPSGSAIAPVALDLATYLASPPAIGGSAAAAGSFTSLSASSTVSGTGFSTYLASPPAIGGTSPATGSFTTLNSSGLATLSSLTVTGGYRLIAGYSQGTAGGGAAGTNAIGELGGALSTMNTDFAPGALPVMPVSGTVYGMYVSCGTTGVNSSSGVFTAYKQVAGSASFSVQTMTTTYGTTTANTLKSDTTHTFTFAAGDRLGVRVTSQASETLANCGVTLVLN